MSNCKVLAKQTNFFELLYLSAERLIESLAYNKQLATSLNALHAKIVNLLERNKQLEEELSACRTKSEILEKQLAEMQPYAALGMVSSGQIHDIRNSLTVALPALELLALDQPELAEDELFQNAASAINCIKAKVSDAQELMGSYTQETSNVGAIVRLLIKMTASQFRKSNVELAHNRGDVRDSCGDQAQVMNALLNLLINSKDAMPKGGLIEISTDEVELTTGNSLALPPGLYSAITIADQGHGIKPENIGLVFEPFFTTKKNGSGLGLWNVRNIVKSLNGEVTVSSQEGQGAVFAIYLPIEVQI